MTPLDTVRQALERMLFLHTCEQEGISSGMPSTQDWIEAVEALPEALAALDALESREAFFNETLPPVAENFAVRNFARKARDSFALSKLRDAEDENAKLLADNARLREALGQISRMRTMPDHKTNTSTLVAAHTVAEQALKDSEK